MILKWFEIVHQITNTLFQMENTERSLRSRKTKQKRCGSGSSNHSVSQNVRNSQHLLSVLHGFQQHQTILRSWMRPYPRMISLVIEMNPKKIDHLTWSIFPAECCQFPFSMTQFHPIKYPLSRQRDYFWFPIRNYEKSCRTFYGKSLMF